MKKQNIVIFTGGSGSTNLQIGLHHFKDIVDVKLVLNAYDNGKSTGAVRKVMDGKILGPSDLRKNQMLQASLNKSISSDLLEYLDKRLWASSADEMHKQCMNLIPIGISLKEIRFINSALDAFFNKYTSKLIEYNDFSISNIIYAGIASLSENSLNNAGKIIASELLHIPEDKVNLISDDSLFLQAITKNGHIILDEGDIVDWNNPANPIVGIQLIDNSGKKVVPEILKETEKIIKDADVLIFSCGTQWSSLIPTYIHKDFKTLIKKSKSKKYLVMNNTRDRDMVEKTSADLIELLEEFLPIEDIFFIFNENAISEMKQVLPKIGTNFDTFNFLDSRKFDRDITKHNPKMLASCILKLMNLDLVKQDTYMFDLDNTLVSKQDSKNNISKENICLIKQINQNIPIRIVTGNSLKHVNEVLTPLLNIGPVTLNNFIVYCDGGNSKCFYNYIGHLFQFTKYVNENFVMNESVINDIIEKLSEFGVPIYKIENRNNCIISIKPFADHERDEIVEKLQKIFTYLEVKKSGRTTIDIFIKGYDKSVVLSDYPNSNILYVGDELEDGNDKCMTNYKLKTYSVNHPLDTNKLLKILE